MTDGDFEFLKFLPHDDLTARWGIQPLNLGVELIGVPLAESVEFATFADTAKLYLLSACLISAFS